MTSLKRRRLDEIMSTSIEDIENMFCWKIGAREVECPASVASPRTSFKKMKRQQKDLHDFKTNKKSSSDSNSCFSSQEGAKSSIVTNTTHQVLSNNHGNGMAICNNGFLNPLNNYLAKPQVSQNNRLVLKSSVSPPCIHSGIFYTGDDGDDVEEESEWLSSIPSIDLIDELIMRRG